MAGLLISQYRQKWLNMFWVGRSWMHEIVNEEINVLKINKNLNKTNKDMLWCDLSFITRYLNGLWKYHFFWCLNHI